jgi:protein O-mannosyl-transferase
MDKPEKTLPIPTISQGLFLLIVTLLVYVASVRFPFIYFDDNLFIVQNPAAHSWSSVPASFFPMLVHEDVSGEHFKIPNFYRPIVAAWVVLNYKIFGLHPMLWRIEILALYGLCVWLFWRLVYMLTRDDFAALAAALLFALHPLHVEGVAWLSGAGVELLLCTFFLGGFLAYLRWRETQRPLWLGWCGVLVLLALLTKETGAALPVLIAAHALIFRKRDEKAPLRLLHLGVAVVLPIMTYAVLRVLAIHSVLISQARHGWGDVLRSAPLFFSVYLKHLIWPFQLANWYDIQIVSNLSWSSFYLPLVVCVAYLGLMVWALARKPLAGFLLLWWVVPLIPALVGALNFTDSEFIHDRFTFVALGAPCVLAGMALGGLPATKQPLFGFRAPSVAALAAITAIFGTATATLAFTWQSDLTMAAHAVQVSPTAVRPRILLGVALERQKDREGALALYRDTLKLDPNRWETLFAYGTALANDGDRVDAVRVLAHGLDVAPSKSAFYLILADILADAGRFDDASRLLERGIPVAEQPELLRAKLDRVQALQHRAANQ